MAKETKHAHQVIAEAEQNKAKDVIKKFLLDTSSSNEMILMGPAGTGKTRIISDLINSNDITITGTEFCAVSNKALTVLYNSICEGIDDLSTLIRGRGPARVVSQSDIESLKKSIVLTTVSKLLGKRQDYTNKGEVIFVKSKWSGINKKTHPLLIIDEFSMIDNYTYNDIMKVAKRNNSKVIFVGDPSQCPPPSGNPSDWYKSIKTKALLTTPYRYGNNILEVASEVRGAIDTLITKEDLIKKIKKLADGTNVEIFDNKAKFIEDAITDYKRGSSACILAYRNDTVSSINNYIRPFMVLDPTELDMQVGDIVICEKTVSNITSGKLIVSESYKITTKQNHTASMYIYGKNQIGQTNVDMIADPDYHNKISDFKKLLSVLDYHLLYLHPLGGSASSIATRIINPAFKSAYELMVKELRKDYDKYENRMLGEYCNLYSEFSYGYSTNIYKSQGSTYDTVYVYLDDIMNLKPVKLKEKYKALYTAITRARHKVCILIQTK